MTYVLRLIKFIIGLNLQFIKTGFFVVKNVGILFQNIQNIPMGGQESQNLKNKENFKSQRYLQKLMILKTYFLKFTYKNNIFYFS